MFTLSGSATAAGPRSYLIGADRAHAASATHQLLADGRVQVTLPRRPLSENEAKRLAWAILADLAPEEVVPAAQIVTYREGARLHLAAALANRPRTIAELEDELGWSRRTVERRLHEMVGDGRVIRILVGKDVRWRLVHGS